MIMKSPRSINVLIAYEESQSECTAFLQAGCNAFSCDLQECSGNHPERHIVGDVRQLFIPGFECTTQTGVQLITPKWDLIIAHPPCTYLSRAASAYLYPGHKLNAERYEKGLKAAQFFMEMYNAPAHFVCVENPTPFRIFNLPSPSCVVNPCDLGSPWLKRTLYWLRNLPPLIYGTYYPNARSYVYYTKGGKKRSKSFDCISKAMAEQWIPIIKDYIMQ